MENRERPLSGMDSLQIIQQMIDTAKQEQKDDGKGWILWGWMLFLASVSTVINMRYEWVAPFFFWNIFGGFSIIYFIVKKIRGAVEKDQQAVKTYTRDLYNKLNTGFFISLMFIIIAMNIGVNPMIGFPLLLNLYGFWVLIYGAVLNFKPSMVGAFIVWALAFACLFVPTFQWVMMLHGVAVLFGYIIPGHMANREFKRANSRKSSNQATGV
jgi:hypothetical protein